MNKHWKNEVYECDCGSEVVLLGEVYAGLDYDYIDLAFFNNDVKYGRQLGFVQKLRWIWQILRRGTPYTDMVILQPNTARKLGKDLVSSADEWEKLEKEKTHGKREEV